MTTPGYSLGPDHSLWQPTSWADVVTAANSGLLDERHRVELKKDIPASSKGANQELACDLASFGVDGGLLVIGIVDDHGRAGEVVGVEDYLALRDRIAQVALSTIEPPMVPLVTPIVNPAGTHACLIVAIPASPEAPHMVDGSYWGRGDAGKRRLHDAEVARLFEQRRLRMASAAAPLHEWMRSSAVPENVTDIGRIYAVASPRGGRPDQAESLLYGPTNELFVAMRRADAQSRPTITNPLTSAGSLYRGNRAVGYRSQDWGSDGAENNELVRVIVEVGDDGTTRLLQGRASRDRGDYGRVTSVVGVCQALGQVLNLALDLSQRYGYYGQWAVGLHVTHLNPDPPLRSG